MIRIDQTEIENMSENGAGCDVTERDCWMSLQRSDVDAAQLLIAPPWSGEQSL